MKERGKERGEGESEEREREKGKEVEKRKGVREIVYLISKLDMY